MALFNSILALVRLISSSCCVLIYTWGSECVQAGISAHVLTLIRHSTHRAVVDDPSHIFQAYTRSGPVTAGLCWEEQVWLAQCIIDNIKSS